MTYRMGCMKAVLVRFNKDEDTIHTIKDQTVENWVDVCHRYDNDVHRLRDASEHAPYTALYECFDEDNQSQYYLVEEDHRLRQIRQKVFLSKLGR